MMACSKRCYSLGTGHLSEEGNEETMGGGGGRCKGYFRVVKGDAQFKLLQK